MNKLLSRYFKQAIQQAPSYFAYSLILTIVCAILRSFVPWILQYGINTYEQTESIRIIVLVIVGIIAMLGVELFLEIRWNQALDRFGGKYIASLLGECQSHLLDCDQWDVMQLKEQNISHTLYANVLDIFRTIGHHIPRLIGSLCIVFFSLIISVFINPGIALFLLGAFVLGTGISYYSRKAILSLTSITNGKLAVLHNHLIEFSDSIGFIQVNQLKNYFGDKSEKYTDAFIASSIEEDQAIYFYSGLIKQCNTLIQVAFSIVLALLTPHTTPVDVAIYAIVFSLTMEQASTVEQLLQQIHRNMICFNKVEELLSLPSSSGNIPISEINEISINIHHYYYPNREERILQNVSFELKRGDCVSVQGKNGAGKSTLFSLLSKSIEHYDGTIQVNGTDLRTIQRDSYLKHVAVISQNEPLLNETVIEELRIETKKDITDEQIISVLEKVHFNDDHRVIENQGSNLSGGQKKKLLLAKLMIMANNTDLLLIDELDAGLDTETKAIYENLINQLSQQNKIILVIQHSQSTAIPFNKTIRIGD